MIRLYSIARDRRKIKWESDSNIRLFSIVVQFQNIRVLPLLKLIVLFTIFLFYRQEYDEKVFQNIKFNLNLILLN